MNFIAEVKKNFFNITSIYISEQFVDIAKGKTSLGGLVVTYLERFPLSKNLKSTPLAELSDEIDKILRQAFPNNEDKPHRVAVNILNSHLVLRRFAISGLSPNEIPQAVPFEVQKYIPCPIDSLCYGYRSYSTGKGSSEIVFVAAEIKHVDEIVNYFKERDILPSIIEPVPVLLAGLLNTGKEKNRSGAYIFVHYEPPGKVILCEITRKYPFFFREIKLDDEEGIASLDNFNYPDINKAWPIVEKHVLSGIDYLRKEASATVEKIFVSGFAASQNEEALFAEFEIPIERVRLPFIKQSSVENIDRYVPALALLNDSAKKPLLNIAPQDIVRRDIFGIKSVLIKAGAALLGILLLHVLLLNINGQKSKSIDFKANRFASRTEVGPKSPRSEVTRYEQAVAQKVTFINSVITRKQALSGILAELGNIMPPVSWIEKLTYSDVLDVGGGSNLTFSGVIFGPSDDDMVSANKIFEDIKKSSVMMNFFKEAELVSVEKKELYGNETTDFTITLKRAGEPSA